MPRWNANPILRLFRTATALLSAAVLFVTQSTAYALPMGGQVAGGSASILYARGGVNVTQSTNRAVINWLGFDIGAGETVNFAQPNAQAIALNRVNGSANPTQILGSLNANGNVWIVNPNGVMFGAGSQVNVGGLLATSSDIDNDRFMRGDYGFTHPGTGSIGNAGNIRIGDGGLAALVGPNVSNSGIINARLGKVALASGDTFAIDLYGDGLINLAASPAITNQLVSNSGSLLADGGHVLLTAAAAQGLIGGLIDMNGVIQADSIGAQNGNVTLYAQGGASNVSGSISAQGLSSGETGGTISVLGNAVDIQSGANLNASGDSGGGNIKIGGDFHGQGTTPTAQTTTVDSNATLNADAITTGNGGTVAVWSNGNTSFNGHIEARGGATSGNGGYVETSGHALTALGTVNAGATNGNAGTWLLDPNNILIDQSSCSGTSCSSANTIGTSLSGGTNVTITTTDGSITLDNSTTITDSGSGTATLTFNAGTDIILGTSAAITQSGTGKLNVTFDADIATGGGAIIMNTGSSIATGGGDIVMGGQNSPTTLAAIGDGAASNTGIELDSATLNAGSGNITLTGQGVGGTTGGYYGVYVNGTTVEVSGAGNISITGTGGGSGSANSDLGVYIRGASGVIKSTGTNGGTITITGTGGDGGGSGGNNIGVYLGVGGDPTGTGGGSVTSVDGNISITGSGGNSSGGGNDGIGINSQSTVSATGNASVTLNGTAKGTGGNNYGVITEDSGTTVNVTNGNLSITGNGSTTDAGGRDYGVYVTDSAAIETTGAGNLSITGAGGGSSSDATGFDTGVILMSGGVVESMGSQTSTGNGTITINGQGGDAGGSGQITMGVYLFGGMVNSVDGNISITGTTSNASGGYNEGITLQTDSVTNGGSISATGNASITLNGTGGSGAGGNHFGVGMGGDGDGTISAARGNISITATGGGSGTAANNHGLDMEQGSTITTTSGAITLTGIDGSGSGGSNYGFYTDGGANAIGTGSGTTTGNITLITNELTGISTLAINTTGIVTFKPYTTSETVGVNNAGSALNVTDTILGDITGASLVVVGGVNDSAQLTATATSWAYNSQLVTGSGTLDVSGAQTMNGHNLTLQTDGTLTIGANLTPTSGMPTLTFLPSNPADTIGVDATTGSTLLITPTDLGHIPTGWGKIVIGSTADSGAMNVANFAWNTALTLNSGSGNITIANASGAVVFSNALNINTTTGNVLMQATADIFETGGGNITTQGGRIVLDANSANGGAGGINLGDTAITYASNGGVIDLGGGPLSSGLTTGAAAGDGYTSNGSGIYLSGVTLNAAGGNIMLNGIGNSGGGSGFGIQLTNGNTLETSGTGNISVTGAGGSTSGSAPGILFQFNTNTIESTGNGSIAVKGTGGSGNASNDGILFAQGTNTILTTGGGPVIITGVASGGSAYGLDTGYGGSNTIGGASNNGNITLVQDSWLFNNSGGTTNIQTSGNLLIEPYTTTGTTIGVAGGSGNLGISTTYLGYMTYGSLTIGNMADTGLMSVNAYSWPTALTLNSGSGNITIVNGSGDLNFSHALTINTTTGNVLMQATNGIIESYTTGWSITTQGGNIVLDSNSGNSGLGGISLGANGTAFTSNGGTIDLGGGSLSGGFTTGSAYGDNVGHPDGIYLYGGTLNSSGGNITLNGYANDGQGILLIASSISSGIGNLSIIGTGNGTGGNNYGVEINGGNVSVSSGNLTITGNGSVNDASGNDYGVYLTGSGIIETTGTGNISITGTGGGSSSDATGSDIGVYVTGSGLVESTGRQTSTGNGTITIHGTGGDAGGSGRRNDGVEIGHGSVTSVDGNISITGTGGNASGGINQGIVLGYDDPVGGPAVATVTASGNGTIALTGTGAGTGGADDGVVIVTSGTTVSVSSGNVSITGNGSVTDASGTDYGFEVANSAIVKTTGTGNISITGTGGGSSSDGTGHDFGVYITGGGLIESTGSQTSTGNGTITIQGTGGGAGSYSYRNTGVYIGVDGNPGTGGGNVTSKDGNISITGTGSSTNESEDHGIAVDSGGAVSGTGNAAVALNGTANGTGGGGNFGVWLNDSSTLVSVKNGNLSITGQGSTDSNGSGNYGVILQNSTAETTGTGNISVIGTGGGTGAGSSNYGIILEYASAITSTSTGTGAITITGIDGSGSGGSNYGFITNSTSGNAIGTGSGTTTGNITLIANDMSVSALAVNTTGTITITPYSTDGTATVGVGSGAGNLKVTDAILGDLSGYSSLTIGSATAGAMEINSNVSFAKPLTFQTGGNLTLAGQLTDSYSGTAAVLATGGDFINTFGSTALNLTGTTPRWLIYSVNPGDNTLDGLVLPTEVYGKTYTGYPPGSVTQSGDVMFYTAGGLITLTADDKGMTYGNGVPTLTYSFGCSSGCSAGAAITGTPSVTTTGTSSSNAGTYAITIAAGGVALTGGFSTYVIDYVNGTLTVSAAPLTITAKNVGMAYADGTALNGATGFTTSGLKNSDAVSSVTLATNATLSSSGNWNAGVWAITPSAAAGTGLSNYSITYDDASTGLTVNTRALTITGLSGTTKVYDTGTTDSVTGTGSLSGIVAGLNNGGGTSDVVSITGGSAAFTTAGVGSGKTVTFTGYGITGTDAADYTVSQPATSSANITAASLSVTAKNVSGTYGSVSLNGSTGFTTSGLLGSDSVTSVTLATNASTSTSGNYNYNATPWSITPSAALGTGLGNYTISYNNASTGLTISKLVVTAALNGSTEDKTYDGNTTAALGSDYTLSTLVGSDAVTLSATGAYDTKNAGTGKTVTFSSLGLSGTDAANYNLTTASLSDAHGQIDKASLTVTAKNVSGTYGSVSLDGTNGFTDSGLVSGDSISSVTLATNATLSTSGNYNYSATPWSITPSGALGTGLGNYTISYNNASTGLTISKLAVTAALNGSTEDKTYDGTTTAALGSDYTLSTLVGSDAVTLSATGAYDTKNAGTGKTVTFSSLALSGTDAANYNLTTASLSDALGQIDKASLSVTADAKEKAFSAADPALTYSYSGLVGGDTASVFTGALTRDAGSTAGTYAITRGSLSAGLNYLINFTGADFTIDAAALSGGTPPANTPSLPQPGGSAVQQATLLLNGTQAGGDAKPIPSPLLVILNQPFSEVAPAAGAQTDTLSHNYDPVMLGIRCSKESADEHTNCVQF